MLPASVRIFLCLTPQDMRRSFDTLALAAQRELGQEAQSGALFVFIGKQPTRVKVLWWDGNGYCLLAKRFHRAVARLPAPPESGGQGLQIDATVLAKLIAGIAKGGSKSLDARS